MIAYFLYYLLFYFEEFFVKEYKMLCFVIFEFLISSLNLSAFYN